MGIWDAVNQVVNNYSAVRTSVDTPKFINDCMAQFKKLDLPYFKIYESNYEKGTIVIEVPFAESIEIKIKSTNLDFPNKRTIYLYINGREIRRIKLVSYEPKYMEKVAEALLDYLKRYTILKNKFKFDTK